MDALQELTAAGGQLAQFFTPAYVRQAQAYAEPLRLRSLVGTAWDVAEYLLIFGLALHTRLHAWCEARCASVVARMEPGGAAERYRRIFERVWRGPGMGAAALFLALMQLARMALDLPENVYFNFIRERREGLSHYTAASFAYDYAKGSLLSLCSFAALFLALYALMRWMPRRWPVVMGSVCGLALLGSGLLDPYRARVYYDYAPLPAGPVRSAIEQTLAKGGVAYQNVVVENLSRTTVRGDAFFAGQGPTRLIVVGDTLLQHFTPGEISAVVAHEMGHLSESVWLPRIASGAVAFLALLGLGGLLSLCARRRWFGLTAPTDIKGYLVILFAILLASELADPLSAWRSRLRESRADAYALDLTRDPQTFATMMAKLAAQNRADPVPWGWYEATFWDHPAPARRIAAALRWASAHHVAMNLPTPQGAVPTSSGTASLP